VPQDIAAAIRNFARFTGDALGDAILAGRSWISSIASKSCIKNHNRLRPRAGANDPTDKGSTRNRGIARTAQHARAATLV